MNILILQPYRATTPRALLERSAVLLGDLIAATPEHSIELDRRPGVAVDPLPGKYGPHAAVRNAFIDASLREYHDVVMWIDVDLIAYPADLLRRLLALGGVAAPAVTLDQHGTFYDIGGFIEAGRPFRMDRPWCNQAGPVVDLDSVGCIYTIPAAVYRHGARYAPTGPRYGVEHWSVCQAAKEQGYAVRADLSIEAVHAWLPDFGEEVR